jgi:hypothetical protein
MRLWKYIFNEERNSVINFLGLMPDSKLLSILSCPHSSFGKNLLNFSAPLN